MRPTRRPVAPPALRPSPKPSRHAQRCQPQVITLRPIVNNLVRCYGNNGRFERVDRQHRCDRDWVDVAEAGVRPRMVDRGTSAQSEGSFELAVTRPVRTPAVVGNGAAEPQAAEAGGMWASVRPHITWRNAWWATTRLGAGLFSLAQCIALFTPRINVGIGVNPTWPANWPAFLARRAGS